MVLNKELVDIATRLILKLSEGHTFEAHLAACMAFEVAKTAKLADAERLALRELKKLSTLPFEERSKELRT